MLTGDAEDLGDLTRFQQRLLHLSSKHNKHNTAQPSTLPIVLPDSYPLAIPPNSARSLSSGGSGTALSGVTPTNSEDEMTDRVMGSLTAPEVLAEMLSVTTGQLAQMRYLGTGPEYVKVGTRVRYALTDIQTRLAKHRRSRT